MSEATRTAALAATGSVLLGVSVVGLRAVVVELTPAEIGFARIVVAGVLLAAFSAFRGRFALPKDSFARVAVGGAALFALNPLLLNEGLRFTTAAQAALMFASTPLWSMLLSRALGGEALTWRKIAGVLATFAGVGVIFVDDLLGARGVAGTALLGDALSLASAVCAGVYSLVMKPPLARHDPLTVTSCAMIVGAAVLLPFAAFDCVAAPPSPSAATMGWLAYLAVIGGAAGFGAWTAALARLSPTQATVFLNLNPVAATLASALLLGEAPRPSWAAGLALIIVGVRLAVSAPRPSPR